MGLKENPTPIGPRSWLRECGSCSGRQCLDEKRRLTAVASNDRSASTASIPRCRKQRPRLLRDGDRAAVVAARADAVGAAGLADLGICAVELGRRLAPVLVLALDQSMALRTDLVVAHTTYAGCSSVSSSSSIGGTCSPARAAVLAGAPPRGFLPENDRRLWQTESES